MPRADFDLDDRSRGLDLTDRLRGLDADDLRRELGPVDRVGPRLPADALDETGGSDSTHEAVRVFASNNYLGLADDPRVATAAEKAAREVGVGAGASRLVTGDTTLHHDLERDLAESKHADRALLFSSGYAANLGTIAALDPDVVFSDALNHASIVDACRLTDAETVIYDHCDPDDLRRRMADRGDETPSDDAPSGRDPDQAPRWLVVTESVFSMDGDVAPLSAICDVADRFGAAVMIDEAHATGLYEDGGGVVQDHGLSDRVDVQMGTLSKALGGQGGFVAGDDALAEYLVNAARSFVFSTGLAPPAVGGARKALEIAATGDRRERLRENAATLRDGLRSMGYRVPGSTQILPVRIDDREAALDLAAGLEDRGVLAPAIRPPTVPEGTSRIRVTPMATHTDEDLDACLAAFETVGRNVGVL